MIRRAGTFVTVLKLALTVVVAGALRGAQHQPGQQRRLGEGELGRVDAEEGLAGRLPAVGVAPEVDDAEDVYTKDEILEVQATDPPPDTDPDSEPDPDVDPEMPEPGG